MPNPDALPLGGVQRRGRRRLTNVLLPKGEFTKAVERLSTWRAQPHDFVEIPAFPSSATLAAPWAKGIAGFLKLIDRVNPELVYLETGSLQVPELERIIERSWSFRNRDPELRQRALELLLVRLRDAGHPEDEVTRFAVGFSADGVLHYYRAAADWVGELLDAGIRRLRAELVDGGEEAQTVRSEKETTEAIRRARDAGVFDRARNDPRMLGASSSGEMVDVFWSIVTDEVPELRRGDSVRWGYQLVPNDIYQQVMTQREQLVDRYLSNLDELGAEFSTWPPDIGAATIQAKEPLAKVFVQQKLGFKSVALASALARWTPLPSTSG